MRRLLFMMGGVLCAGSAWCAAEGFTVRSYASDPSLEADSNECYRVAADCESYEKDRWNERYRVIVDLNGDGADDVILSDPERLFGNGGGCWTAYVHTNGVWTAVGSPGFHPTDAPRFATEAIRGAAGT